MVKEGTRFRSIVADCNALWEVKRKAGRGVWECFVVNEPSAINGRLIDGEYAGRIDVFREADIKAKVAMEDLFAKNMSDHERFYASLQLGQIVHYDSSFGQYVRCEVVMGTTVHKKNGHKCLKPIALVGAWPSFDLPRRGRDGEVVLGYQAEKIANGVCFEPNSSCIYEGSTRPRDVDPRGLPAIDLSVPPATDEQKTEGQLWKAVDAAREALGNDEQSPRKRLETALAAIQGALAV